MAYIVNPTISGGCYWEINNSGRLAIYGSDEDGLTEYVLDEWSDYPPWYEYKSQIKSVNISSDTVKPKTLYNAFYGCSNLTSVTISKMSLSYCTVMEAMFKGCINLSSLSLTNFDTSTITNMRQVFYNCRNMTSLDLSGWDMSSVTTIYYMFYGCSGLTSLDLSAWDTSAVTIMTAAFYGCSALTSIDLSGWNTSSVTEMYMMFYSCTSLVTLDLSDFDVSALKNAGSMFAYCTSLVTIYASEWTDEATEISSGTYMFRSCTALVGAISYDSSKLTIAYANTTIGYFTASSGSYSSGSNSDITGTVIQPVSSTSLPTQEEIEIYYESSSGEVVDLNGDDLWIQNPEAVFKTEWSYDYFDSVYGGGKVSRFYEGVQESETIELEIAADTMEEYSSITEDVHDIIESDVRNETPGKMWVNSYYRECFIHSREYSDFDISLSSGTMDLTALYVGDAWINEISYSADDVSENQTSVSSGKGIKRPADLDLGSPACIAIENQLPYDMYPVITFYGPAENPYLIIGDELYQVRQTLYEGESCVYDAKHREITGYIEAAREPDEDSYSTDVPEEWESGMTLYRTVMATTEGGGTAFAAADELNAVSGALEVEIDDVLLSAESTGAFSTGYILVDDAVLLGSGDEDTSIITCYYGSLMSDYGSILNLGFESASLSNGVTATQVASNPYGDTINFTRSEASASSSDVTSGSYYLIATMSANIEDLGLDDETDVDIGFISGGSDGGYTKIICALRSDGSALSSQAMTLKDGEYQTMALDISGADEILIYICILGNTEGDYVIVSSGYITPAGAHPASAQMAYSCSQIGEKNWFDYRNLDAKSFEPVEPGTQLVIFNSSTSFDLTLLQERSEPPWT